MKRIIVILIMILVSCKKSEKTVSYDLSTVSPDTVLNQDSWKVKHEMMKDKYLDKDFSIYSPVRIVSIRLFKNEYSNFKNIRLTFKNTSEKNIQAIKFQWYTENALNEPSNLRSFYQRGESGGLYMDVLKPDKTSTIIFEEFSSDAKRVVSVRAYEVFFSDGTKWQIKNQSYLDLYLIKV